MPPVKPTSGYRFRLTSLSWRWLAVAVLTFALAACGGVVPRPSVSKPPSAGSRASVPAPRPQLNAALVGVRPGPPAAGLGFGAGNARAALASFIASCPRLVRRSDNSGLTRPEDWQAPCSAAPGWPAENAAGFFARWFETAEVSDGRAFVTGYYEPEIAGVRTKQPGYTVPVYGRPPDLTRARPGEAPARPDGTMPPGRYDENGRFVPYYDRAAIEDGALAGQGLEIAWVADPVEFFFLQIQGSGRLVAPDGTVMRIGFAVQNV